MNLLLVSDAFPPMCTSAAVHMHDLAIALHRKGHAVTIVVPNDRQCDSWVVVKNTQYDVVSLRALKSKDVNYVRRALAEFISPYLMYFYFRKTPSFKLKIDQVVWYSPNIFWGPFIRRVKKHFSCPSYLILRDLFPEWAVDLGLMQKGFAYKIFKIIEHLQYSEANKIGVQAPGNLGYFSEYSKEISVKTEVLWTWNSEIQVTPCSVNLNATSLAGRLIFVYAGNIGVAQNLDIFIQLASMLKCRQDIGFLFVGRGSEYSRLKKSVSDQQLNNTLFLEEIDFREIPALYAQCHVGLISLDLRHRTHNIPGKFISCMQSGLPVLANINKGNDLSTLIEKYNVGLACSTDSVIELKVAAEKLLININLDSGYTDRCQTLVNEIFSVENAVNQITNLNR